MKKNIKLFMLPMLFVALLTSCKDNDPLPVNPVELITNVNVIFTNANDPNDIVTLTAVSADGIVEPTLDVSGPFTAGATYNATITITDEVNDENILEEVVEEADEHFFWYVTNPTSLFTTVTRDADDPTGTLEGASSSHKLGLETTWVAGAAGAGTITVRLTHEPTSVDDNGLGTATGGEFDIDNTWNITIQ